MFCSHCGKEINDNAVICPHCGVATDNLKRQTTAATPAPASAESNTLAIVGFVLSFIIAIAGLICSIMGYKKAQEPGMNGNGKGLALAGIIISAISMGLAVIFAISWWSIFSCAAIMY